MVHIAYTTTDSSVNKVSENEYFIGLHWSNKNIDVLDFACPSGWKSYGSECYKLHEEELTWEEARATCEQNHQVNDIDLSNFLIMDIHI